MLAAVAHATGMPVGVPVKRLQTISIAGLPEELFTADMSATRIRWAARLSALPTCLSWLAFVCQVVNSYFWSACCVRSALAVTAQTLQFQQ